MTYNDAVNQAIELTVITDSETGMTYLEPRYRVVLEDNGIHLPGHALNGDDKDKELWEILKLEVEKRNAKHNVSHALAEWAYQVLINTVDPALTEQENDLMKNILDYMKLNEEVKEKRKELDEREEKIDRKDNVAQVAHFGISFAKKEV